MHCSINKYPYKLKLVKVLIFLLPTSLAAVPMTTIAAVMATVFGCYINVQIRFDWNSLP